MFDEDLFSVPRAEITFTYVSREDNGDVIARLERTIRNDEAEYLPHILNAFLLFLQGMTFTYVDTVTATSEKGTEYTSELL